MSGILRPVAARCLERNGHDDGLAQDPNAIGRPPPKCPAPDVMMTR
jgi:hypothetical protein